MNYFLHSNGQQSGPYPIEELRRMLASGEARHGDLCWREGLSNWIPVEQVASVIRAPARRLEPPIDYAGFWRRAGAFIIDYLVLLSVMFCFGVFLGTVMIAVRAERAEVKLLSQMIGILLFWVYFATFESSPLQATLGKLALGIRVTDESGYRVSFARATGRHFAKILSGLMLGIGYLMVAFSDKKQALHDSLAKCLVIRK